jgi:hypothetical protein
VVIRNNIDLLPLRLLRNALHQLRRSCLDATTRWHCRHDNLNSIMRERFSDATPVVQARKEVPCESKFVETKETMGEDYRVFLDELV